MQINAKAVVSQKVQCVFKQLVLSEVLSACSNTFILICQEF